jgi:protoporphyrinogen/coproporphyrinogen III oxidase
MKRVAIVGGGIAGLAVAHALRSGSAPGEIEIVLYEKSPRCGGNLRSERTDGFLCEWAANGFLDSSPPTLDLMRTIGLESRVLRSNDAARRRYILRDERLHPVPDDPVAFARSHLLSWRGRLRVMREPFARPRPPGDETIHEFAARRIGREAAEIMVGSMVSGIFAGDARRLSLKACFPKMWDMETEYGGLVRALIAKQWSKRRERRGGHEGLGSPAGTLTSFQEGIEELPRAVAASLGGSVRLDTPVTRLDFAEGRLHLSVSGRGTGPADAVVLAGPASHSGVLVAPLDERLALELAEIETAPIVVVCLGYEAAAVERERGALDGFGFLVPRGQGPRVLGVLWDSSIYPNRAPGGAVLIRAMLGGAHDRSAFNLTDAEVLNVVRSDLNRTMGLARPPDFVKIVRHRVGIPQYTIGHLDRLARIEDRLARIPGLYLAGNSYRGPSINSCIAEAGPLAARVLARLRDPRIAIGARASRTRRPSEDRPRANQPST